MTHVLEARQVTRTFDSAAGSLDALRGVSLHLDPGELLVMRGPSGSGKTTLLNILGGLDSATGGSVLIDGIDIEHLDEDATTRLRRERLGFVFQSFALIPVLSAAENVELPLRIQGMPARERAQRVEEVLALVSLSDQANQRPGELSGGQQQRVGVARALAGRPAILLADEPTGQLDSATAEGVMELFRSLVRSEGVAILVTTHDPLLVARADRVLELHDGLLLA